MCLSCIRGGAAECGLLRGICGTCPLQAEESFVLKEARRKVNLCIEHFILVNGLGGEQRAKVRSEPPDSSLWHEFVQRVSLASGRSLLDESGRYETVDLLNEFECVFWVVKLLRTL